MSLEAAIVMRAKTHSGLNALISGRIYDTDDAPQNVATPYLTYLTASVFLHQAMGPSIKDRDVRIQFDYYASTRVQAIAGREQLISAFNGWRGDVAIGSGTQNIKASLCQDYRDFREFPDTSTDLKRESVDFIISH